MKYRIHYDATTGDIKFCEFTNMPQEHPLYSHVDMDGIENISAETHRFDLITKSVVGLSDEDKRIRSLPKPHDVDGAIRSELSFTDKTQLPDGPTMGATVESWREYRHKLRRLSDLKPDVGAMVNAWPFRPNGDDAIQTIRARFTVDNKPQT